jgi:hypothetical protein
MFEEVVHLVPLPPLFTTVVLYVYWQKSKDTASPHIDPSATSSRSKTRDKSKMADDKDRTIESLREKCQELIRLLGSQQKTLAQVHYSRLTLLLIVHMDLVL